MTKSGINTSNITIRDEQAQQALTGKTAEQIKSEILTDVTTDTARENSGALKNNFDKDKVQSEINLQVDVTRQFGANAPKAVADYAQQQALKQEALGNKEEAEKWREGGIYRVAMHTVIGAISTGSLEGALTTGGIAVAAPKLNDIQKTVVQALASKGMKQEDAEAVVNGVTSLALIGAGVGSGLNSASVASAVNVDSNNRQLHREEVDLIQNLAEEYAKEKGISLEEAETQLTRGALYNIDEGWKEAIDSNLDSSDISKYNQAYQYLLAKTKESSVDQVNSSFYFKTKPDGTIVGRAKQDTYAGHISDSELQKADFYVGEAGKGFTATDEDFKNKDIFLTNTLAGSTDKNSPQYNDKKEFMQNYAAIQSDDVSIWEHVKTSADKDIGSAKGFGKGILTGGANLVGSISDSIKGLFGFIADPVGKTEKAVDKANQIKDNLPEITNEIIEQDRIAREKYATTLALYDMQRDAGAKAEYEAQPYGELVGGAGLGSVGKKTVQSVGKAADEAVKNVGDHLTPKPATVAGTPDLNGGATTMTGTPDVNGGIGKTEVAGATMAVGYEQPQNPQGIYDPQGQRADLEAVYGVENISSTTVPKKPYQASATRSDVIIDVNGGKAVKITLQDGTSKMIPYDSRGLPIFDDVVIFTTKLDETKSYAGQMKQASKDMWSVIKDDPSARNKFTDKQLKALEAGREKIPGYTWHHNSQSAPNNMQLVPNSIHSNKAVPHSGQNSLSSGNN